jgi:hypothetical protein
MCIYTYTYIHTSIHIYIYTYTHIYIYTYTYAYTHMCIYTHDGVCVHSTYTGTKTYFILPQSNQPLPLHLSPYSGPGSGTRSPNTGESNGIQWNPMESIGGSIGINRESNGIQWNPMESIGGSIGYPNI